MSCTVALWIVPPDQVTKVIISSWSPAETICNPFVSVPVWHTAAKPSSDDESPITSMICRVDLIGIELLKSVVPSKTILLFFPLKLVIMVSEFWLSSSDKTHSTLLPPPLQPVMRRDECKANEPTYGSLSIALGQSLKAINRSSNVSVCVVELNSENVSPIPTFPMVGEIVLVAPKRLERCAALSSRRSPQWALAIPNTTPCLTWMACSHSGLGPTVPIAPPYAVDA